MSEVTKDIYEIFTGDPLQKSETDIEALVADFRAKRHLFNLGDQKAGTTKAPKSDVKLSLKSLGL